MPLIIRVCDEELQAIFDGLLENRVGPTFDEFLGITVESPDMDTGIITFNMREALIGNPTYRTLQGGVIATVLDMVGGHVVFVNAFKQVKGKPLEKQMQKLSKVGTIDLRIDYLQPGRGESFVATGRILRRGNKVAVTRMEMHNEKRELIAVGTGTYTTG